MTVSAMPSPIHSSASLPEMFVKGMTATVPAGASAAPAVRAVPGGADCMRGADARVDAGAGPARAAMGQDASIVTAMHRTASQRMYMNSCSDINE